LATEPLWAVPVMWIRTYASLFMAALGLSATQIGWIASLVLVAQMLVAPFGGLVADRYGRKRTLITFDVVSWIIPLVLWMIAQNIWYFAAAAVLNGLNMIVYPTWNCLLVEDTESYRRASVFAGFQLVVLGAGVSSPVAGWIVNSQGVITGTRILYAFGTVSVGIMILLRGLRLKETSIGSIMVQELRGSGIRQVLNEYRVILAEAVRNRRLVILLCLGILNLAHITIWNTYYALYLTNESGINLSPGVVSLWPTFSACIMIAVLVFVVPRVREEQLPQWLILSSAVLFAGMLVFILAPPGGYRFLIVAAVLIGIGTALLNPVRDTFTANVIDDKQRACLLAAMNSLGAAVVLPLTPLAGYLFEISPRLPILLLQLMLAVCLVMSWAVARDKGQ